MRDLDSLKLALIDDKWEIVGHVPVIGPYETKAEGMEALAGVKRFYQYHAVDEFNALTMEDVLS